MDARTLVNVVGPALTSGVKKTAGSAWAGAAQPTARTADATEPSQAARAERREDRRAELLEPRTLDEDKSFKLAVFCTAEPLKRFGTDTFFR